MAKLSDDEIEELLEELDDQFQELSEKSEFGDIYRALDKVGHRLAELPLTITAGIFLSSRR